MTIGTTKPLRNRWLWRLCAILLGGVLFVYGFCIGRYKWPPFGLIQESKTSFTQRMSEPISEHRGEQELLQFAFTDPVAETNLYYPPITSLKGIREANQRIFIRREGFDTAYQNLEVLDAQQLQRPASAQPVVKVRFRYQDSDHESFAYGRLAATCDGRGTASLIIPGSGLNQSLGIATDAPTNYHHGILAALNKGGERYTFIKPNEDLLAWHDGKGRKLHGNYIWNWHLNRDGSYSMSYLVESMAFTKWLKGCYGQTIVVGLSQGGAATLLNALQTKPNIAIVASGHSLLNDAVECSGHNQLMGIPGYGELARLDHLVRTLSSSPTQWFFSWGRLETGTYKLDAEGQVTANAIGHLPNVTTAIHDDGHVFPVTNIKSFIDRAQSNAVHSKAEQ